MCIAIVKPVGKSISDETLKRCFNRNKDGCGFAFIKQYEDGSRQINTYKHLEFDPWLEEFRREEMDNPSSPFLIHFRIKTHGLIDT